MMIVAGVAFTTGIGMLITSWWITRMSNEERDAIDACPSDRNIDRQIRETFLGQDRLVRQVSAKAPQ
jgi:hypothetical protein